MTLAAALALGLLIVLDRQRVLCVDEACPSGVHSDRPAIGRLHSPNHPDPYPAAVDCSIPLTTVPSNVVRVKFTSFDLAPPSVESSQCLYAYVLIIVADRQGRQHVGGRICGNDAPMEMDTMQYSVTIQFVSLKRTGHKGFALEYEFVSEAAIGAPRSLYGDPDGSWQPECGGISAPAQSSGEIVSPGFPSTYPRNVRCNWLIRVEPRQRIYIRLVSLYLASTIAECERAALLIMDGYRHEGIWRREYADGTEARFCGQQDYYMEEGMKSYMSTSNRLLVRFVTSDRPPRDFSSETHMIGFKVIWTAVDSFIEDPSATTHPSQSVAPIESSQHCAQFLCNGGQLCLDQGHSMCSQRVQLCISSALVCDGVANCPEGDFSDELHCRSGEIGIVAGTAAASLLLLIAICVCCERARKRRNRRKATRANRVPAATTCSSGTLARNGQAGFLRQPYLIDDYRPNSGGKKKNDEKSGFEAYSLDERSRSRLTREEERRPHR